MVETRFIAKGRKEATLCKEVRSRVCGDMCLGISRKVTSYQKQFQEAQYKSLKAGAAESSQGPGSFLKRRGSTNEEKRH